MTTTKLTARDLQLAFFRYERDRYQLLVPNTFIKDWFECDIIGVRESGYVDEIEVKISKSDFKEDFKKKIRVDKNHCLAEESTDMKTRGYFMNKHRAIQNSESPINYYWMIFPEGVVSLDEVPEEYGVMYVNDKKRLSVARQAKRLHNRKADQDFKYNCLRNVGWKYWDLLAKQK